MKLDMDAITERAKAATPGPWKAEYHPEEDWHINMPVAIRPGCYRYGADQIIYEADAAHIAGLDPQTVLALVARAREADRLESALKKINAIRNSIIGFQNVGWSEHIYPLVAALQEAGIEGQGYEEARAEVSTLLDQVKAAEAENTRLRAVVEKLRAGFERLRWLGETDDPAAEGYETGVQDARNLLAETATDVLADNDGSR